MNEMFEQMVERTVYRHLDSLNQLKNDRNRMIQDIERLENEIQKREAQFDEFVTELNKSHLGLYEKIKLGIEFDREGFVKQQEDEGEEETSIDAWGLARPDRGLIPSYKSLPFPIKK